MSATSTKIDPMVEKALLVLVEKQNKPRKAIVLVDLCNTNVDLFGSKGTQLRRDVQEFWNNVRRRFIRSYARLLDNWRVPHSASTKSLLQHEGRCPLSTCSLDESDEFEEDQYSTSQAGDCLATVMSDKLSLDEPKPSPSVHPTTLFISPIASYKPSALLPQMNNNNSMWQTSDTPTPSVAFSSDSSSTQSNAWSRKGTRQNPFVIRVDLDFCEQNYPFDIIGVPRIEHGGWAWEGLDIRMAIGVGDADCWEAWVDDTVPELQDHAIMIRGRSRSLDYDAIESYHRDEKESDTAAVHKKQKEAIQRDPSRQALYWRIITPNNIPLDNVILSGDSTQIVKKEKGVKRMAGEDKDVAVLSYFVNWVIAKRKTGHQISTHAKTLLKDAFA